MIFQGTRNGLATTGLVSKIQTLLGSERSLAGLNTEQLSVYAQIRDASKKGAASLEALKTGYTGTDLAARQYFANTEANAISTAGFTAYVNANTKALYANQLKAKKLT